MDSVDDRGRRVGILAGDDLQAGVPRLAERGADTIFVSANWSPEGPTPWRDIAVQLATRYNVNLVIANRSSALTGIVSRAGRWIGVPSEMTDVGLVQALETAEPAWSIP